jgi:hypothetical protein
MSKPIRFAKCVSALGIRIVYTDNSPTSSPESRQDVLYVRRPPFQPRFGPASVSSSKVTKRRTVAAEQESNGTAPVESATTLWLLRPGG